MSSLTGGERPSQPGPGGLDLTAKKEEAGSRRSLLVAAAVIFDPAEQKVLVARRRADDFLGGFWELPGGKVEAFEDPRIALRRELQEELDADVEVLRPVETIYSEYERFAVIILCYLCRLAPGAQPRPIEVEKIEWAPLTRLDEYDFVPGDVAFAAELAQAARRGERPLG
jgi:8-oxo-dGTP diphosphatase